MIDTTTGCVELFSKIYIKKKYRTWNSGRISTPASRVENTSFGCCRTPVPGQHLPQVDHLRSDTPATWIPADNAGSRWVAWFLDCQGRGGAVGIELHTARIVRPPPIPIPCLFPFSTAVFREPSPPPTLLTPFWTRCRAKIRSFSRGGNARVVGVFAVYVFSIPSSGIGNSVFLFLFKLR